MAATEGTATKNKRVNMSKKKSNSNQEHGWKKKILTLNCCSEDLFLVPVLVECDLFLLSGANKMKENIFAIEGKELKSIRFLLFFFVETSNRQPSRLIEFSTISNSKSPEKRQVKKRNVQDFWVRTNIDNIHTHTNRENERVSNRNHT